MNLVDYKQLADNLLDFMCETYGIVFAATHLIAIGFTNDNLLELGFEQETIHQANENVEKGE